TRRRGRGGRIGHDRSVGLTPPPSGRRRRVGPTPTDPHTFEEPGMFAIDLLKTVFQRPVAASRHQRRVRTLLAVESLEAREVLTLSRVPYNAGYPFTSIVELQATFPDHTSMFGSGGMVDRFH